MLLTNAKIWVKDRIIEGSLLLDDERGVIQRIFSHSTSANEQNEFKINLKQKLNLFQVIQAMQIRLAY